MACWAFAIECEQTRYAAVKIASKMLAYISLEMKTENSQKIWHHSENIRLRKNENYIRENDIKYTKINGFMKNSASSVRLL